MRCVIPEKHVQIQTEMAILSPFKVTVVRGELQLVANPPPYTTETLFSASNLDSAMTRQVQT